MKEYPTPWRQVLALTPHIWAKTRYSVKTFTEQSLPCLKPDPQIEGLENLPPSPAFVLAPNHYQRPGLWILHPCSVITVALQRHYDLPDPPIRWVVTANWPPVKIGPWKLPSPGDWLLPRVAHALHCYPVSFAGTNPALTARSYRTLLKDAKSLDRPLGIFPEGVAGRAFQMAPPLPGVERLFVTLAKLGLPVVPCGMHETDRLVVRFGSVISPAELESAPHAADLIMARIRCLTPPRRPPHHI